MSYQQDCNDETQAWLGNRSDLMKIVGGPFFVRGPTVGPTGDTDGLDTSEVPDDLPTKAGRCPWWWSSPQLLGEDIFWLCIIINVYQERKTLES